MMKVTKRLLALLLAGMMLFVLAACTPTEQTPSNAPASQDPGTNATDDNSGNGGDAPSGDPIKIGHIGSIAGDGAYIGQACKAALEDYVADLNARGGLLGRPVEVITYDYSVDPATEAITVTNRLIQQDKVQVIIGPTTSVAAIAIADLIDAAQIPLIASAATNGKVTVSEETGELHPYMFRVCFIDPYQGFALADFAYKQEEIRKVALFDSIGDAYSQAMCQFFKDRFEELGGEIVGTMGYQRLDVEFRAQLSDANSKGAEAIFMPATTYKYGVMVGNQAQDMGYEFQFLFGDALYAEELLTNAGPALEGALMTNGVYEDDPAFAEYKDAFAAAHPGVTSNMYSHYSLDAIMLFEWAVNKAQSVDGPALKEALESAENVELWTDKSFTVDPSNHNPLNKTVNIIKIVDSQYTVYDVYKPED
ncbi:ABC transporter substrate-binding protein [Oscillospiraceae bacterium OttesenSCG-928-G22]|nr:ABC transporter substrate-binding protein [Oscillospiraceae bacterium OttesenSCG-928-G22]